MLHLHYGAAVSFCVVYVEGDEVFTLDTRTTLVINAHVLPLKAQLEETTLRDGHLHLSVFACYLGLDDVILALTMKKKRKRTLEQQPDTHSILHWLHMYS